MNDFLIYGQALNLPQASFVRVIEDFAYIGHGRGMLSIYDVSNLEQPDSLGSINLDSGVEGLEVAGNCAYVADGRRGVVQLNITDKTNPQIIREYNMGDGKAYGLALSGAVCLASDGRGSLLALDIVDQEGLTRLGSTTDNYGKAIAVDIFGRYLFGLVEDSLKVFNLNQPAEPVYIRGEALDNPPQYLAVRLP